MVGSLREARQVVQAVDYLTAFLAVVRRREQLPYISNCNLQAVGKTYRYPVERPSLEVHCFQGSPQKTGVARMAELLRQSSVVSLVVYKDDFSI